MGHYTKKPVTIEAFQYNGNNGKEIVAWSGGRVSNMMGDNATPVRVLVVPTLEGNMRAMEGDWIIKGIQGEFYPCRDDIFQETYDEATGD